MKTKTLILSIDALGSHGEGIGRDQGYTIFVEGALPQEVVEIELIERKKNYGIGRLLQVKQASPHRISPPCSAFGTCGGCQLMHLSYPEQLTMKRQRVLDALTRIGKMEDPKVKRCIPSPQELAYRNKIQLPARQIQGKISLGLFAKASHHLIPLDRCLIHCSQGQTVYESIRTLLNTAPIAPYDPISKQGELRHVLIKSAIRSQESLVVLISSKAPTPPLLSLAQAIKTACPQVKGVIHNRHAGAENCILGKEYRLLEGKDAIEETLCDLTFRISAASFFQVNPLQAENLYQHAFDLADLKGDETVLDAYCGVGTLALVFAKKAKKVIGIETIPEAIEDAKRNALKNQIDHAQFIVGEAENIFKDKKTVRPDLLLLNPPRKGCDPSLLKSIGHKKPNKILYISCDPATLARDLAILQTHGYRLHVAQPFDMFPQTAHVECVALLTH